MSYFTWNANNCYHPTFPCINDKISLSQNSVVLNQAQLSVKPLGDLLI